MIAYHIDHNLSILFIGINPHPGSDRRGVPFSNNKMFWYLLHAAGLLPEELHILKKDESLHEMYTHRFTWIHRLGVINMVDRPTPNISHLIKGEELFGRARLHKVIQDYTPQVVCFVGKITYQTFTGLKQVTYGWKEDVYKSKIYVMHTPLRGHASIRVEELKEIKEKLRKK